MKYLLASLFIPIFLILFVTTLVVISLYFLTAELINQDNLDQEQKIIAMKRDLISHTAWFSNRHQ